MILDPFWEVQFLHSLKLTVRTWKNGGPQKETTIFPTINFQVLLLVEEILHHHKTL